MRLHSDQVSNKIGRSTCFAWMAICPPLTITLILTYILQGNWWRSVQRIIVLFQVNGLVLKQIELWLTGKGDWKIMHSTNWAYIISTDWYTWRFKKTQSLTNQSWLSSTLTHPIQEPNFGLWMSCSDNIFNSTVIKMLKNDDHGRFMTELCCFFKKKNALYLSVNVSSMKVLIGDTIFKSPTGGVYAIFRGHLSYAKVHPPAVQREYLHFSVILRPWVMVRPQESSPRPPALQSSTLPTMLILPKFKV